MRLVGIRVDTDIGRTEHVRAGFDSPDAVARYPERIHNIRTEQICIADRQRVELVVGTNPTVRSIGACGQDVIRAKFVGDRGLLLDQQQTAVPYELSPDNVLTAGTNGSNGGIGSDDQFNSLTIGDTYLFSPNVVNSFRISGNRVRAIKPGANMFGPADVGINAYTYQPHYLSIPVTGAFSLGSANFSENSFAYTTAFGANDDVNI